MTRTTVGGIAVGAFLLGILLGVFVPSAFARWDPDRMPGSMSGLHGAPGMPMAYGMHAGPGIGSMPMMGGVLHSVPMHAEYHGVWGMTR